MRTVSLLALSAAAVTSPAAAKIVAYYGKARTPVVIYAAPSAKAKAMCRVEAGAPMVINAAGTKWYAVVMKQGRLGYAPAQAVEVQLDAASHQPFGFTEAQIRAFSGVTRRPGTGYVASRGGVSRAGLGARQSMAASAMSLEGTTPYRWGGTQLGSGIDCSGFVQKMAGEIGMSLPRTAAEQAQVGMAITNYEQLQAGDRLYFWDAKRGKIGHTGIYVGGGYFTHSSSGHHGIARDFLSERWRKICVAARR